MKHLTNYDKVRQFHKAFNLDLDKEPTRELIDLRATLLFEEYEEVSAELFGDPDALAWGVIPPEKVSKNKLAKELADLLYVAYGTAATFGIDIDVVFNRVHESNMSKLGEDGKPVYRDDGKVLKSSNYVEPDLDGLGL